MFKVLRVYEPGGLGERTTLLKQLVDQQVPLPLEKFSGAWMRQWWLYSLAAASRPRRVLFLKEQPRDPQEYKGSSDPVGYPSFFLPEWKAFIEKYTMREIRLDLGALGHARRKPTLGENIGYLNKLEGMSDRRRDEGLPSLSSSVGERTSASRTWAAWGWCESAGVSRPAGCRVGRRLGRRLSAGRLAGARENTANLAK